ncbi:MAG: MFS transporter [Thermodesulfobacteriota bacterium]
MTAQRKGYLAVGGSSIAIFWCGSFIFGFPGVMAAYWQELFHVGRGAIGSTLFFVLAATGIFMFFVGRWQLKLGIRRMVTIGVIIVGLDQFLLVFATNIYLLYLWAFLMGFASCFIYIPGLTTVQRWFPARRGLVSGIVNCTFGISAAIMSPIFGYLLKTMDYGAMNVTLGLIALAVGLVAAQFTEMPRAEEDPAQGSPVSGAGPAVVWGHSLTVSQTLRTSSFWFLWITWALQGSACISMVMLSIQFGLAKGFALESAVIVLTAFNLTNGLSRLLMGYLSDIIGRTFSMSLTFLAAGIAYLALPHLSGLPAIAITAAVIGFAFGTLFAVSAPLTIDCFGVEHFGAIFGVVFTAYGFVAGPLGPSLSGHVLDLFGGNFVVVFTYLAVFCLISGILIRFVVPPRIDEK